MAVPTIDLSSNTTIPQIGFGTWLNKNEAECKNAIKTALDVGYRHFDTAQIYENEQFIGTALAESSIPRSELFVTTKIWNENMYWDGIIESFDASLQKLKMDYVDLLLLHFPVTELRGPAWGRMEDILTSGQAKAIGVSNYTIRHLEELLRESKIKPAVNQVELHVFLQQPELTAYCRENHIAIEAYSPLAHGYRMNDGTITTIAKKHNKTNSQIMLRWCVEQHFITLPKSVHPDRIKENFEIFDFALDDDDLKQIQYLDCNLRIFWDPTHVA